MPYSPNDSSVPPLAWPRMRPRCCLRCLTLRGINMSVTVPGAEVRGLVVLADRGLDGLLLGEQALELRIGFLDQRRGLLDHGLHRLDALTGRLAAGGGRRGHDLAGLDLARGLTHGHGRFLGDLVLEDALVGQDVALVDPDLDA